MSDIKVKISAVLEGSISKSELANVLFREAVKLSGFNEDDAGCDWVTDNHGVTYIGYEREWVASRNPMVAKMIDVCNFLDGGKELKMEKKHLL
ncbi:hypothetical protein AM501_24090 [Aneurinibacillus migulanus]|uniref:hypothetical protein n=1 Tax=Aneurinibacillus migulanus TaxID=47500 RepID=UPI0005BC2457|nr:hypothetical protein [Aneurinibacillus migulanus]KIV58910.1 hypothetical protein TS64_03890 [Aneurinibacillus migulanus]KPD05858.1 hypothetical protein AM501_24090 [Aneurinibacillus migulanus]